MEKNLLVWILTAALLLASVLPAGAAFAAAASEPVTRLLDSLIRSLYQEELLFGDELTVLDAFERFDRERSWETLQLARAALSVVRQDVANLSPAEAALTAEDEKALLDMGTDISYLDLFGNDFLAEQTAFLNTCSSLQTNIMLDMFLASDWEIAMQHVRTLRSIADANLQYYANLADWTLIKIGDPQVTEAFNAVLEEYCPLIHARQSTAPVSAEENEAASDSLLRTLAELNLEISKIAGAKTERASRLNDWITAGSWEKIGKDLLSVSDLPALIFFPARFETAEVKYFWTENDQVLPTPLPAAMPDRIPDICRVRIEGVPLEEAEEYRQALADAGVTPLRSTGEEGTLNLLYAYDGTSVSVTWEGGTLTVLMLDNPACFVPQWYLPARNAAAAGS